MPRICACGSSDMARKKVVCRACHAADMRARRSSMPKAEVPVVVIRFRRRSLDLHRPGKKRNERPV